MPDSAQPVMSPSPRACGPVGGWLADRIGGARVLWGVFAGIVPFALVMSSASILPFSVGALGCAVLLGLGNGGVFKLVPQYFPKNTGVVTGLVGAMGGLGGFFPPLLLGSFRDRVGVIWPGFVLLAAVSAILWKLNARVFLPQREAAEAVMSREHSRRVTHLRAGAFATSMTAFLGAAIVIDSRNLQNFDAALVIYTFATVFILGVSRITTPSGWRNRRLDCIGVARGTYCEDKESAAWPLL